jgi:eukaryotic-like serine/threonine-protein kinase
VLRKARQANINVLPPPYAVFIAMEMCKGLHYAHTRLDDKGQPLNIIHRDVSPQNLILSYEGQVKIVDFGIAKARNAGQTETESGAVKGKYVYFAPEQARGKELDARTDVFAAGIVLYEMLCGKLPFEGKMMDVLGRIIRGEFQRPRAVNDATPAALERIVLTSMATEKAARYESAQAFHNALAQYLYSHAPTFSSGSLGALMSFLFEKELLDQGIPVKVPPDFLDQLSTWRAPPPEDELNEPTRSDKPKAIARAAPPTLDSITSETDVARPPRVSEANVITEVPARERFSLPQLRLPRWAFFAIPVVTMLIAALAVISVGYFGTFSVQVTSDPSKAVVIVDGQPASAMTPLLISELPTDKDYRIEVQAPGMKPWSTTVKPVRGETISIHAELKPETKAPSPDDGSAGEGHP